MIIGFTVENYKSFSAAATVTFAAGTTSRLSGNLLQHPNGERFVKSMAMYGPNASGKTTFLDAIFALWRLVDFSSTDQKPTARIPRFEPFALDKSSSKRPSRVAITIDLNGNRYTLDVSVTAKSVWSETLTVNRTTRQPSRKTKAKLLIERKWDPRKKTYSAILAEDLGSEQMRNAVIEQTTPNRLMLGKLASLNSDIARSIAEWFDEDLEFYDMHRNPFSQDFMLAEAARLFRENDAFAKVVARFMKDADTGIRDLKVDDETHVEPVYSESDKTFEFKKSTKPGLLFRHAAADGSEVTFRRQRESSGTLRFVAMLAAILHPGPRRRLVCIDELSASMHPDLVRRLIRIVHSRRYNMLGSQILFTTHDTHLMDPREILRPDQVTICGKDRSGRSTTRRLDEFQDEGADARSDANLQKQYLEGRFGGVPQFGPTLEDIPGDDEPLEVRH